MQEIHFQMSGISSTYLLQRLGDGTLSFVLCVRHAEGGALAPVRSTDRRLPERCARARRSFEPCEAVAHSSPTRRDDFVRGDSSGARPAYFVCFTFSSIPALAVELNLCRVSWNSISGPQSNFSRSPFRFTPFNF